MAATLMILKYFLVILLAAFSLFLSAETKKDYKNLFIEADQIKTADFRKFQQIILELEQNRESFTEKQLLELEYFKAYAAGYTGNYSQSIEMFKTLIPKVTEPDFRFKLLTSLANLYSFSRNFPNSFASLFEAFSFENEIKSPEIKEKGFLVAAVIYNLAQLHPEALEHAEVVKKKHTSVKSLCIAEQLIAEAHYSLRNPIDINQINQSIDNCRLNGEMLVADIFQRILPQKLLDEQNYSLAEQQLNKFIPAVESHQYPRLTADYYLFMAKAKFGLHKYSEAEVWLDKTLELSKTLGFTQPLVESYLMLSDIYKKSGNFELALDYYKKYADAEKAYRDDLSEKQLAYQLAKGEVLQKNQKIKLLEKDNSVLTLRNELNQTNTENQQLFIALLTFSIIFLTYFALRTLKSKQYYRLLAENDNLTGISNRFHFTDKVKKILEGSNKLGQIDSFLIFDLDFFKQINDQYGHLTGDWVLQTVVAHSKQFVRNLDVFGRIGGEEFAIYLPACTAEKAALLAEILRDAISQIDYSGSGHPIKMTASFGVTATDRSGYELKKLFRDADHALYQSKHQGRNQVSLFEEV
ncbi:tetratricopeptide repeat-containing diguanylate cyclase [Rheinheimera sp.]|uniref:tetratricopeptide repeat-containing diguanylate cyclase n=1 Tax=Rheinheimera sp. TaxID=1869214 RepID=UPI002FDD8C2D